MRNERFLLCVLLSTLHFLLCTTQTVKLTLTGSVEPSSFIPKKPGQEQRPNIAPPPLPSAKSVAQAVLAGKAISDQASGFDQEQESKGIDKPDNQTLLFGPHMFLQDGARNIGEAGDIFLMAANETVKRYYARQAVFGEKFTQKNPHAKNRQNYMSIYHNTECRRKYKYREADGSCNNLRNPLWGRRFTPFERFIPAFYDDGIQTPRETSAVSNRKLPGARKISTIVHTKHKGIHRRNDINDLCVVYGQFLSHDMEMNALARGYKGSNMDCCKMPNRRNCFPIKIDKNDPHFGSFGRRCMNMVRTLPTPALDCIFGQREQLNQVTHFIDASQIYGSDKLTTKNLRTRKGGKLKSTYGNLLPQDLNNKAACIMTNPLLKCFIAGDVRVNQQPMLMAMHTIWLREHNHVAEKLSFINPHWRDEKLFQESRKIVTAEFQHITYNEFLLEILGSDQMERFDLNPLKYGYFTGYDEIIKPQIRNVFAAAAYRFGHSMIRNKVISKKVGQTARSEFLFRTFLRPDLIYSPLEGVDGLTRGLYVKFAQSADRFFSPQLTNHLFERRPGHGGDLAAINIQRGRDHGLANYNTWRLGCGLNPVENLYSGEPVHDHDANSAQALSQVYSNPDDFDVYTGGVSEVPVAKGKIGPLFACLIGLQFKALKYGDRFYYETNNARVKFTPKQLAEIRKTTMARVICDHTDAKKVPTNVFRKANSPYNVKKRCDSFTKFDWSPWKTCIHGRWSPWKNVNGNPCVQRRLCNNPAPQAGCGKPCKGLSSRLKKGPRCKGIGIGGQLSPRG